MLSITDKAITSLARSCTRLRYIDLACCPLLTDLSVFELAQNLPRLKRIGLVRVSDTPTTNRSAGLRIPFAIGCQPDRSSYFRTGRTDYTRKNTSFLLRACLGIGYSIPPYSSPSSQSSLPDWRSSVSPSGPAALLSTTPRRL